MVCRPAATTMRCRGTGKAKEWRANISLSAMRSKCDLNYRGGGTLRGSRCYVTLFPCNECAKAIIQAGIKEVIYMCDKYADSESTMASKKMFEMAGVKYTEYENQHKKIEFEL